jgi:hypothetical protein
MKAGALASPSLLAHYLPDTLQFASHLLVGSNDGIESIGNFSGQSCPGARKAHGKIAIPHSLQAGQDRAQINRIGLSDEDRIPIVLIFLVFGCTVSSGSRRISTVSLHNILLLEAAEPPKSGVIQTSV